MNLSHTFKEGIEYRSESDAAEEHLSIRSDEHQYIILYSNFMFQPNWLEMGGGEEQLGSDELRYAVRLG